MFIKKILKYDVDAQEADIIISDGNFDIMTYAQPFNNDKDVFELYAFRSKNIMRALEPRSAVNKTDDGYYAYRLQGKIIDLEDRIVTVGGIKIILENSIPNDIKVNEYIEFDVLRIDFID